MLSPYFKSFDFKCKDQTVSLDIQFEFKFDDFIPIEDIEELILTFEKYLERLESTPAGLEKISINEMNKYFGKDFVN
jgi:hypothetical protein